MKLVVVDYESGNLRSVSRALESCGVEPLVSGDPGELADADAVVLPGVGAGPAAMTALEQRGLVEPLRLYTNTGVPSSESAGLPVLLPGGRGPRRSMPGIVPGK